MATTTIESRWPIWTDRGTGSDLTDAATPATWVFRLADGTYLTAGPDGAGGKIEMPSRERPLTPDGLPIPLQWHRLAARLPPGAATEALVAELEACGGAPDRDLLWRLVTAVANDPMAPAPLLAEGVRVECVRGGWVGSGRKSRGVDVRVTYYL
jgi:hypothetical protein